MKVFKFMFVLLTIVNNSTMIGMSEQESQKKLDKNICEQYREYLKKNGNIDQKNLPDEYFAEADLRKLINSCDKNLQSIDWLTKASPSWFVNYLIYKMGANADKKLAEHLLANGLDINRKSKYQAKYEQTMLGHAILNSQTRHDPQRIEFIKFLISKNVDINPSTATYGLQIPIFQAICRNNQSITQTLIEHGANLKTNDPNNGDTVLHFAIFHEKKGMLSYLLNNYKDKIDLDAKNNEGKTSLQRAKEYNKGFTDAISVLVQHGATDETCKLSSCSEKS